MSLRLNPLKGEFMASVQQKHRGSRKILNGEEVWTVHTFPPEYTEDGLQGAAIVETENGDFLLMNGEFVKDRVALETLPEQHRGRAIAWWNKTFGVAADVVPKQAEDSDEDIQSQIRALQDKLTSRQSSKSVDVPRETEDAGTEDEANKTKRSPGRPRLDRGSEALKQQAALGG